MTPYRDRHLELEKQAKAAAKKASASSKSASKKGAKK